jgi:ankyrin repeat protein
VIRLLFAYDADPNIRDNSRGSALHQAGQYGHLHTERFGEVVELLLEYGVDFNMRDEDGETALHKAIGMFGGDSDREIVKILLEKLKAFLKNRCVNTFLKIKENLSGCEDLQNLALNVFPACLMHDFVLIKNNKGKTALDVAREKGNNQMVQLLESYLMQQQEIPTLKLMCLKALFNKNNKK